MLFAPEDREKIARFLQDKLKACPMCLTNRWVLQPEPLVAPVWAPPGPLKSPISTGKGAMDLKRGMPLVAVMCGNCGLLNLYPYNHLVEGQHG